VIGLRIEPRYEISWVMVYSMPVLALVLTLVAGIGLFCGLGINAWAALYHCFIEPFETSLTIDHKRNSVALVLFVTGNDTEDPVDRYYPDVQIAANAAFTVRTAMVRIELHQLPASAVVKVIFIQRITMPLDESEFLNDISPQLNK